MPQFLPDMIYGDDERHRLDLFLPDQSPAPLFFFVHGGGWRGGDKQYYRPLGELLVNFGYAVALPHHRLAPAHPHPAQIHDMARALGFVMANAEEAGIQREGICLAGHSSGGHLVSLLALDPQYLDDVGLTSRDIAGVVSISGVYDLEEYRVAASEYLSAAFGHDSQVYQDASPLTHVHPGAPPFLLAYAEHDYLGADRQAARMREALGDQGVLSHVLCVDGRDHVSILTGIRSLFDPLAIGLAMFLKSIRE
jgi:acetyl esterase/lipase